MLKWQDPLSNPMLTKLRMLATDLRANKTPGWSVVLSKNEIIARPPDRKIGKFSITVVKDQFALAFFSTELSIWNKRKSFVIRSASAASIKAWMEFESSRPLEQVAE